MCIVLFVKRAALNVVRSTEANDGLISALRSRGYIVTVEADVAFRMSGAEMIGIFVGSGAATALIQDITTDIYNSVRKWSEKKPKESKALTITIYGPDKKELASLEIPGKGFDARDYVEVKTSKLRRRRWRWR